MSEQDILLVLSVAAALAAMTAVAYRLYVLIGRATERRQLHDVADLAVEGLLILRGERIVGLNRSMAKMLPGGPKSVEGHPLQSLLPGWSAATIPQEGEVEASLHVGWPDEPDIPVHLLRRELMIGRRAHTVVAVRDRRERLRFEAELRRVATTDALTGLANRARFDAALAERYQAADISSRGFTLLMIDLDRFKIVNDAFGHAAGDALLVRVAKRIQALLGPGVPIARMGCDEFSILLDDGGAPDGAEAVATDLIRALSCPFLVDGRAFDIGATIGIAAAPGDGDTPSMLTRHADLALHHAKASRRGSAQRFEPPMAARALTRRALEIALRRAVADDQFELYFQPQMDLQTGQYDGAEALIRWNHPERGLVPPIEFISIAEETGLINAIGAWVLRTACATAAHWPAPMRVAVNLSPIQFRDRLLDKTISDVLDATGLDPSRLELEITESVLIEDEERTFATLSRLRTLGVRISLDDFGTGYSSLSYLRRFPFDKIKIDQSFVRQTPDDRGSSAIVRAVVALGTSLGMTTTAEGVETLAQHDFVSLEGCTQVQGFLISKPVPQGELPNAFVEPREAVAA